jgi:4-hydroxy-tetrahydrodipicolinate synthase
MRLLGFDVGEPIKPNNRCAPEKMAKLQKHLDDLGAEKLA